LFCYDTDVTEQGAEENIWTKEELRDFIIWTYRQITRYD
jgi:hypothetical protein